MDETLNAMCCFCGEYAPMTSDGFLSLIVVLPDGATQGLWTHGECLRRVLHPSEPTDLPEAD